MGNKIKAIITGVFLLIGLAGVFIILSGLNNQPPVSDNDEPFYGSVPMPERVDFAGEEVPLDRFDIRESLDRELMSTAYFHSQTIRLLKLAPRYFSVIEPILKEHGIPDDFKYLCVAESGFNVKAVSPAKAVGLWQLLEGTAKDYGLEVSKEIDERYHIEKSTVAACKYLNESHRKFGNWALVAASYNAGRAFTTTQMERQKSNNYFDLLIGEETARYVFRILSYKIIMSEPKAYGFYVPEEEKYPVIDTKIAEVSGPVASFADFASQHGVSYKMLKTFNPWLREPYLTNPQKKSYQVKIPVLK